MSKSARARRMARNHKRLQKPTRLNLVALMDIFTILVLFLIVNNGDVEVLQPDKAIALPESRSEQRPGAVLTIKISPTEIQLDGRQVDTIDNAMAGNSQVVATLEQALREVAEPESNPGTTEMQGTTDKGQAVVIMGDQSTPYGLLKRIMATCAAADFRDVSLAVNHVAATPMAETDLLAIGGASP